MEIDDEYIGVENDPCRVEKITKEDYTIPEEEKIVEFDEIVEIMKSTIDDLMEHDNSINDKVFDTLRKGGFRK